MATKKKSNDLIYKKMANIMKAVEAIPKKRKNQAQGYEFRGIDDVYASLHDILAKEGVFVIPKVLKVKTEERESKSGSTLITRMIRVKYTFVAEDGSKISAKITSEGMDSGDKALNKAMSAAQKYLFLQVFAIPTRDQKDSEYQSPEPAKSNMYSRKPLKSLEVPDSKRKATKSQKKYISDLLRQKKIDRDAYFENKKTSEEMLRFDQASKIIEELKETK